MTDDRAQSLQTPCRISRLSAPRPHAPAASERSRQLKKVVAVLAGFLVAVPGACAQGPSAQEIENWFNQVDSQAASSLARPAAQGAVPSGSIRRMEQMLNRFDTPSRWQTAPSPQPRLGSYSSQGGPPGGVLKPPGSVLSPGAPGQSPFKLSKQDLLRIFFGGSSSPGNPAQNAQKLYGARENLEAARDFAARADAAAARTTYGPKDQRLSAASEAQYNATAARGAADRATSAAYGGSVDASDAAAQARAEADRAQAAADRARYNAETAPAQ